jgi:hypothetical protein
MKKAYVLVEGETDKTFLEKLLEPQLLQDVHIVVAEGKYSIPSLARSLLAMRRKPIAVLIDTDSIADEIVRGTRESITELLRAVGGPVPVMVATAVPELEAFFFASPPLLERFFGAPISTDMIELGKRDPRGVLDLLTKKKMRPWDQKGMIDILDSQDIERIREMPELKALSGFLRQIQTEKAA